MIWKRRTAVLVADELIVTTVQLKNDVLYIQVSNEADEWSQFELRNYEISFLRTFKHKVRLNQRELPPEEQPALMILYDRAGVIAMSVVLKNSKEFEQVFSWVKDHFKMHVNVITKNSYLEDKFEQLTLECLVPPDYFIDGPPPPKEKPETEEPIANNCSVKLKAFQTLSHDIRDKKILINSVNGCQLFKIGRNTELLKPEIPELPKIVPTSVVEFAKGYGKKLLLEYDFKTLMWIGIFYGCLLMLQVFTPQQLVVCTVAVIFAIAKFDLHLARIREDKVNPAQKEQKICEELYSKRLVSFSRPEVREYLEAKSKTIRLHANKPQPSDKSTK